MMAFWLLAATLVAGAMACLLPPLLRSGRQGAGERNPGAPIDLYREQLDDIEADLNVGTLDAALGREARNEVGRRLLDEATAPATYKPDRPSPLVAGILLAALPGVAIVLYLHLGNPVALWNASDPDHAPEDGHEASVSQVEGMVNQLAQRLRSQPDDAEGWYMLARSYVALERNADAAAAYAKAIALAPNEAALRADYADVLASVDGGALNGLAFEQIDRALALDPDQPKALALAASAAEERGDTDAAVRYWEQLHRLLPPDSETATVVAANIAQARVPASSRAGNGPQAKTSSISGQVSLGKKAGRTPRPDETVFVYARAVEGSRLPLAVMKARVRDLPLDFTLDDSLAMRPDHRLSGASRVIVEARISESGNAVPSESDLIGRAGPVPVGQRNLKIEIGNAVSDDRKHE